MKKSPEVDRYIENAPAFAQPILTRIRRAFHKADPQIEETMKWSFPHFEHNGIVGSIAAFKQHVSWGFWKGQLMKDPLKLIPPAGETSMGGFKVRSVDELPSEEVMLDYIREAVRLNDEGVKIERAPRKAAGPVEVPDDLKRALKKSSAAAATFKKFPPSHQREYIEWITEAKQAATREKRLTQAIEWMAEGKPRNWKYMRKS